MDVFDVAGDVGVTNLVEVFLQLGANLAVLVAVGFRGVHVAIAFHLDDDGGPFAGGLAGTVDVDDILALVVAAEGAMLLEVVRRQPS